MIMNYLWDDSKLFFSFIIKRTTLLQIILAYLWWSKVTGDLLICHSSWNTQAINSIIDPIYPSALVLTGSVTGAACTMAENESKSVETDWIWLFTSVQHGCV